MPLQLKQNSFTPMNTVSVILLDTGFLQDWLFQVLLSLSQASVSKHCPRFLTLVLSHLHLTLSIFGRAPLSVPEKEYERLLDTFDCGAGYNLDFESDSMVIMKL